MGQGRGVGEGQRPRERKQREAPVRVETLAPEFDQARRQPDRALSKRSAYKLGLDPGYWPNAFQLRCLFNQWTFHGLDQEVLALLLSRAAFFPV